MNPKIVHTPGVCFGRARLEGTRMPVWTIELWHRMGQDIKSDAPHLTDQQIKAALRYARDHREEIDHDIRVQDYDLWEPGNLTCENCGQCRNCRIARDDLRRKLQ